MLSEIFAGVERGAQGMWQGPPADGSIRVIPQPSPEMAAVVSFTAHILIAADVPQDWAASLLPAGDLSAPMNPPFLTALSERLGMRVPSLDMMMFAPRLSGPPPLDGLEASESSHPRVLRAHRYRSELFVYGTKPSMLASGKVPGGMVLLGRGVAGRWEMAFEVDEECQGKGLGRLLALSARHLVPSSAAGVWAQVTPGNAASVRALIAAGFVPVGSEALLVASKSPVAGG